MFALSIWILSSVGLTVSFFHNKKKTKDALKVSFKFFRSVALTILMIVWMIGFLLAFLPSERILNTVGREAGLKGMVLAALFGSVVLIQAFIAFPLAGAFLRQGADIRSIAAFVTTLVMVGIAIAPLEVKFFGKKFSLWRNGLSFVFAIIIALIMGALLR